jgi:threonine aldolase
MKGLQVDPDAISTNIVYIRITEEGPDAQSMAAQLGHHGVRVLATAKKQMRAVFNYQVEEKDVDQALSVFSRVVM